MQRYAQSVLQVSLHLNETRRFLTSNEVSAALRPFYFSVHPDLFGQYPAERSINENSLKQLSSYLETLQEKRHARPVSMRFFLRPQQTAEKGPFKSVTISLAQRDVREAVLSILKSSGLPTTYVDNITPPPNYPKPPQPTSYKFYQQSQSRSGNFKGTKYEDMFSNNEFTNYSEEVRKVKDAQRLSEWLKVNGKSAAEKHAACIPVYEEVERLQHSLKVSLNLRDVLWDCGWNITHFRGCLQSFQALARDNEEVKAIIKDRTLVFGSDTGLSLNGNIFLCSGEVRHNWLDFLKNVWKQDEVLLTIPAMQKAVSRVLCDIQIVHRKFQRNVMATNYKAQLRHLITSLSDYKGRYGYPKSWPTSLREFELVVEREAGPLMLSPTGQFIVPSSCPSFLLVSFLSENLEEAQRLLNQYKSNKYVEKNLHEKCVEELCLRTLHKEDNVTPDLMIECCRRLLEHKDVVAEALKGQNLCVTHYYSLMSDGQICIPWNWKL